MNAARSTARTALARSTRLSRTQCPTHTRFQSSSSSSSVTPSNAAGRGNSHLAAGAAGGLATGMVLYGLYLMTPSGKMHRTINKGAKEVQQKYNEAAAKIQNNTPDPDGAIQYIKEFSYSYVAWVPGGRQYVDTVFKDVEALKQNHREEVNQIISDAYKQFQELSKSSLGLEAASKAYNILVDLASKFGDLAGSSLADILNNHPEAKEKFGGSIDKLKDMGENYGPEAKKQIDRTWKQAKDILSDGASAANLEKVRRLVEDKIQQVKKLGDDVWEKALEAAKPYLDKNPVVKSLIEKNADALKQGNAKELFDQVKRATESGDTKALEDYVNKAKSKGEQATSELGIDKYFNMIPSGSEILRKINHLRDVASKHGDEGEKLLAETAEELKQVLEKKSEKAKAIAEKTKKDAK
ncbi:hypothetical protein SAMD00023353_2600660 [Rosellinia necatrix]|uniref:Uncharacterized protein n=1 Tax=Rosellinia necatrix TaxID=77044 RepID=A0A1W2TH92_ROSNE|nr:hypothetical protein SAMD00023353_2600660 [Rosellinia necatrix]